MNDPQRKGPLAPLSWRSDAQTPKQDGLSNGGPLSNALSTQDGDSENMRDAQGRWPADVEDGQQCGLYETVEVS